VKGFLFARRIGAGIGIVVLGVGAAGGAAWAAGGGSGHTTSGNAHGTLFDAITVTFVPGSSPVTLPQGCWMPSTDAFMSMSGNAQFHNTFNKNGFWLTTTFAGTASVQPITFAAGRTATGTAIVVTTSSTALATGHLTIWDGISVNKNTVVETATLNFKGTDATGMTVSMNGQFHFTVLHPVFNTTGTLIGGTPTAVHGAVSCS